MKKCSKGIKILAVIYVAVVLAIIAATAVDAKEPTFKSLYVPEGEWHNGGHLFIVKGGVVQTGWTTYNGHLYYCHKTASEKYPIGSVTRGEIRTVGGNLFIYKHGRIQTGWVRYKGHTYYCHKTGSNKYPVGSATRGEMRVRKGKFIAFKGSTGQRITKDYYVRKGRFKRRLSLKMNRDGSVRYVYNTSACFGYRRYSTKERRYQEEQLDGSWKTVGMQFWPDYIDWQE